MSEGNISEWQRELSGFDKIQGEMVVGHLRELGVHGKVLDIACGDGWLTQLITQLPEVAHLNAIDESTEVVKYAEKRQYTCPVKFDVSRFEDYSPDSRFDSITALNILEHVEDQVLFLKRIKSLLKTDGKAFLYVPNANSFHVLLAVEMGVIPDKYFLNEWQQNFVGHTTHYDMDMLRAQVENAGLDIEDIGSIIFKPFSNSQMDYLVNSEQWGIQTENDKEIRGWASSKNSFYEGLYRLGKKPEFQGFGSTLYVCCKI